MVPSTKIYTGEISASYGIYRSLEQFRLELFRC